MSTLRQSTEKQPYIASGCAVSGLANQKWSLRPQVVASSTILPRRDYALRKNSQKSQTSMFFSVTRLIFAHRVSYRWLISFITGLDSSNLSLCMPHIIFQFHRVTSSNINLRFPQEEIYSSPKRSNPYFL
jgi:hypothetical protein